MKALRWVGVVGVVLIAWHISAQYSQLISTIFSTPLEVFEALISDLQQGRFYAVLGNSCLHVVLGTFIGAAIGIFIGAITAVPGRVSGVLEVLESMLRPVPPLACIPVGILAFGTSSTTAVFIVAVGVSWTCVVTTREAVKAVPVNYYELATAVGYHPGLLRFRRFTFPAALPGIFGGIRTAVGQGWTLVIAAELSGVEGLGQRLWHAAGLLASDRVMSCIVILGFLNRGSDWAFEIVEKRLFAWRH